LRSRSLATLAQQVHRELHLRDGASALAIEGLLLELLGQAAREGDSAAGGEQPAWLRRATDFIHENAAERLRLSSVAEAAGVHPAHLAKTFRRHYHCTVGEYVRRLRLERAARELAGSAKSLVEIAVDAGFYDQSHFTNAFRLHTGTTPARYRRTTGADAARPTPPRFPKTS
jgi:AraC family transcriptional regulator